MNDVFYENYRDKDDDLYVGFSSDKECKKHFHRNFELLYITDGEMRGEINGTPFLAQKDDIVFVSNYYIHSYCIEERCDKYCLIVPANMSADFMSKFKNSTLPALLTDKEFNKKILRIIKTEDINNLPSLTKKGYMLVMFGMLLDHYPKVDVESNSSIEVIVSILNYIEENYNKDLTLESLAQTFGYNKYYFSKLFNRYISENLTGYINTIRLQHMMTIATKETKPNIASLAFECGFDSLATFYRYFSKTYGCSPTDYLSTIENK